VWFFRWQWRSSFLAIGSELTGETKMTDKKIEAFWRDATAEDVAGIVKTGKPIPARIRNASNEVWREDLIAWLDKPDPGEGYRLLEKFPAEGLQPGDEWFEPSPFEVGWKVSHNERQADILWYRRRVEPNSPEKLDSCVDHLEVGKEYKLPSGQSIFVTEKGFEVV